MSAKRIEMHRLREMVRLHRMGTTCHRVAQLLQMSPNTERKYRLAIDAAGLLEGPPEALPEVSELKDAVERAISFSDALGPASSAEPYAAIIEPMLRNGAGPKAIYDKLRLEHGEAFTVSYHAIKRLSRRLKRHFKVRQEDVVIPVDTKPGLIAQVDFGEVCRLQDPLTGEYRRAWVFVMVLGFSRHMFARIVFDQRAETWQALHVAAFEALGGVPEFVVPDNLKAAVIRAAFRQSEASLNRSYRDLAQFYRFKIDPAPPRQPQKKGKVESAVNYVKSNFIKPRSFTDIDAANEELARWIAQTAGQRVHGTTGKQPLAVFESEERGTLTPLPSKAYVPVIWKKSRVLRDSHVHYDRRLYSVPWRYIGRDVWLRVTPTTVEIEVDSVRVATHRREGDDRRETTPGHLPEHRAELQNRDPEYWQQRAEAMGPEVGTYIREIFESDSVLSHLRTVQRIIKILDEYPKERAAATCKRAQFYGLYTPSGIRRILEDHLDAQPLPMAMVPSTSSTPARYARTAAELMRMPLEVPNEPC